MMHLWQNTTCGVIEFNELHGADFFGGTNDLSGTPNNFSVSYRNRRFITVFTGPLPDPILSQMNPHHKLPALFIEYSF
jgi:hypothetical protein